MLTVERQSYIKETAKKSGAVKTDDLMKRFNVSAETIRRDLIELEAQGVLHRVYGGAVACGGTVANKHLDERIDDFREQKRELSEYAASLVNEGDIIAIDEGTTALEFAEVLAQRFKKLTVVTHSLDVLEKLKHLRGINVILCGGTYMSDENALCGEITASCYEKIHVMKSFIFPSAISLKDGIMCVSNDLMRIQKVMLEIADQIIIMADGSKFEKNGLYKLCPLSQSFVYVSDSSVSQDLIQLYKQNGINLLRS